MKAKHYTQVNKMKIQSLFFVALFKLKIAKAAGTKINIIEYVTGDVSRRCPTQCSILRTNSCRNFVNSNLDPKCMMLWHKRCIHRRTTCSDITKKFMFFDPQLPLEEALNSTSNLCPFECSGLMNQNCTSFISSEAKSWELANPILSIDEDFLKCSKAWNNQCEKTTCGQIIRNEIDEKMGSFEHDYSIILPEKYFQNQTSDFFLKLKATESIATVDYKIRMMALQDYCEIEKIKSTHREFCSKNSYGEPKKPEQKIEASKYSNITEIFIDRVNVCIGMGVAFCYNHGVKEKLDALAFFAKDTVEYLEKDKTGETYFIQASQEVECMVQLENGNVCQFLTSRALKENQVKMTKTQYRNTVLYGAPLHGEKIRKIRSQDFTF